MKIETFGVERWMDEFENDAKWNLAETCVDPMTIEELLDIANKPHQVFLSELLSMKMTYGAILGSERLRTAVSKLYATQDNESVIITHGTIGANSLVYHAAVGCGDHVIAVLPTYQQHQAIPKSVGATVELLRLRPENNFLPDLDELRGMMKPNTKLIAINNPNNPTGALMDRAHLEAIVEIAKTTGAYVLCDEVYRGLDTQPAPSGSGDAAGEGRPGFTVSIADLYEKGISTASMTKAFSLAGLRLGWVVTKDKLVRDEIINHRDYNTISVGMIDDYCATLALEHVEKVIARSQRIAYANRATLCDWVASEPSVSFTPPQSGTTALIKLELQGTAADNMTSREFCVALLEKTGVMLVPGSVMEMEGYVRLGYTNGADILCEGLKRISAFLAELRQKA